MDIIKESLEMIGATVSDAIEETGKPIEQLARDTKMSKRTIYNIMGGGLNYTIVNLLTLCSAIGLSFKILKENLKG